MKRNMVAYCAALFAVVLAEFLFQSAWAADVQMNGDTNVAGGLTATSFTGSGAGLTGIPGTAISNTSVTVNQLADSAVTSAKLANDAVTPTKIAFYSRVAIVAAAGGDYADPATAMADYSTWCPSPSSSNPCLLKIMPGLYDVGTASVQMQQYIDIEGSGENSTIITGNLDSSAGGVINGASNAEARLMTIKNTGGGTFSVAIFISGAATKITQVTTTASGATYNYAVINTNSSSSTLLNVTAAASGGSVSYAILNATQSSVALTNVTATASGASGNTFAVYNSAGSSTMFNVTATGTGGGTNAGIYNYASAGGPYAVTIRNSVIRGTTYSIANGTQFFNVRVSGSELSGSLVVGSVACAGVFNAAYTFYANTCPTVP